MKYLLMVLMLTGLVACSTDKSTEAIVVAKDGINGVDGKNGHSIVTTVTKASECECETSGSRIDMFLDLNDSLLADEGDLYQNSFVVCDGRNGQKGEQGEKGEQGPQGMTGLVGPQGLMGPMGLTGPQGPAGAIGPQGVAGERGPQGPVGPQGPQGMTGPAGSSATIKSYTGQTCTLMTGTSLYVKATGSNNFGIYTSSSCSSSSKQNEVSQGESYWVSSNSLVVWNDGSIRVITYN